MSRKVKFTKEMILEATIEMVRETGIESINARDLGGRLGCSSRPLFTAFKNMEELIETARKEVSDQFLKEVLSSDSTWEEEIKNEHIHGTSSTKEFGIKIAQYAKREPNLYNFIHWKGGMMPDIITLNEVMCNRYSVEFDLTPEEAKILFNQMSIFSLGLCSMITHNVMYFSDEEITDLLKRQFISNLSYIKRTEK